MSIADLVRISSVGPLAYEVRFVEAQGERAYVFTLVPVEEAGFFIVQHDHQIVEDNSASVGRAVCRAVERAHQAHISNVMRSDGETYSVVLADGQTMVVSPHEAANSGGITPPVLAAVQAFHAAREAIRNNRT